MTVSAQTLADLRRDEGWSARVYNDSLGIPTIGYGFRLSTWVMPRAAADLALDLMLQGVEAELTERWPAFTKQPDDVRRGLLNMGYNLGIDGLLEFKLMLAALERGDRETAAVNALNSKWAKQVGIRAERIANLIRGSIAEID
jgi:lysozyme